MSDAQHSTFECAFCPFEEDPQVIRVHLIDEHAVEIADQHWASTSTATGAEIDERV